MQEEFKHIVRIAGVDIDGNKSLEYALPSIRGVGPTLSCAVCDRVGVKRKEKLGDLTDKKIEEIEEIVENAEKFFPERLLNHRKDLTTGTSFHVVSNDYITALREDIEFLRKIRCYRGIRHEKGLKVRGQKNRNHGRGGLAVGVSRSRGVQGKR